MICRFCASPMAYVHGHAACIESRCPMFGLNQAECCDGETIANCPAPTAVIARQGAGAHADSPPSEESARSGTANEP